MAGEGIQNYVDMAAGLRKATKEKARAAAQSLLAAAGLEDAAADATDRATKLAEEVLAASRANRELMGKLIASEVDKAAGRLGFVRAEELDELRQELAELRMSMAHGAAHAPAPFAPDLGIPDPPGPVDPLVEPDDAPPIRPIVPPAKTTAAKKTAAKKTAAKKTAAKKTAAKKTAAKRTAAKKSAAKAAPDAKTAVSAPAQRTTTKKTAARKAPAKKTAAKKTAAKKTAASGA